MCDIPIKEEWKVDKMVTVIEEFFSESHRNQFAEKERVFQKSQTYGDRAAVTSLLVIIVASIVAGTTLGLAFGLVKDLTLWLVVSIAGPVGMLWLWRNLRHFTKVEEECRRESRKAEDQLRLECYSAVGLVSINTLPGRLVVLVGKQAPGMDRPIYSASTFLSSDATGVRDFLTRLDVSNSLYPSVIRYPQLTAEHARGLLRNSGIEEKRVKGLLEP